jgi:outer membrane protein OmpA-like peptidoglycan-associated protein
VIRTPNRWIGVSPTTLSPAIHKDLAVRGPGKIKVASRLVYTVPVYRPSAMEPLHMPRALILLTLASGLACHSALAADPPGEIKKPGGNWQVPGEIKVPTGKWQVPGEIQKPGEIQVPGDIKGVKLDKAPCEQRLTIAADTLFDFDKHELTPAAMVTLEKLGPTIKQAATWGVRIEGHTDGKGTDAYNQPLSERRAETVKAWLSSKGYLAAGVSVVGHGKRKPVATNAHPDGRDDPEGRALNRRVELVFRTCK